MALRCRERAPSTTSTTEVGIKNPPTQPVTLRVLRAVAHPKGAHEHRIFAAALMTTTVIRAAPAPGPAAALWLAATKASAPAYPSGWQSTVVEAPMSWAAVAARKPWR